MQKRTIEELKDEEGKYGFVLDDEYYRRRKAFEWRSLRKSQVKFWKKTMRMNGCRCCGSPYKLHRHHIRPLSRGGSNDLDNITIVCEFCHRQIHGRMFFIPTRPKKKKPFVKRKKRIKKPIIRTNPKSLQGRIRERLSQCEHGYNWFFCYKCKTLRKKRKRRRRRRRKR